MNKTWYLTSLKGMAMGMAEVVPGVSGGTIAFITGIYVQLLASIRAFHPKLIDIGRKEGFKGVWKAIHGNFLSALLVGMAGGIIIGVFGILWLIENHPKGVWSFFFGLIIASAFWVAKSSDTWRIQEWIGFLVATAIAYGITVATPAVGTEELWFVLLSGIIAISAMLLPGISGSFLLLLMGMYEFILGNVRGLLATWSLENFMVVGSFAVGCIIGLAGASRVLHWIFLSFRNVALAILTGFMFGSLNRLWPWKRIDSVRINSHGEEVPFIETSILPTAFEGNPEYALVIFSALAGFVLMYVLGKVSPKADVVQA